MRHSLSLRALAHHESGHAVAAWAFGIPVVYATIEAQGEFAGHVQTGGRSVPVTFVREMEDRAVIDMAGPAAQRLYAPHSNVNLVSRFDLASLAVHADVILYARDGQLPPDERKTPFGRIVQRQARRLMTEHWLAVHRVALTLLETRSMSGFAVAGICQEATAEWTQLATYHPGQTAVDYVRAEARAARPLPPLRRATIAAAALRAALAGAPDIASAVAAALTAKGYHPEQCRAAWLAAQRRSMTHDCTGARA